MFKTNFLSAEGASLLAKKHGTSLFVYSKKVLQDQAHQVLGIPAPFGLTVRYAMKANPHPGILSIFKKLGVKIDASSGYEAVEAIRAGYDPQDILLTSQQLADKLGELVEKGIIFNATSLHQLEEYGKLFPNTDISVRINPGIGSGHSLKVNVGGTTSCFGIWHEYIPKVLEMAEKYKLNIIRLHTHIGAGADPIIWQDAARLSMELIKNFPNATIINLGGGFKVARMDNEHGANMQEIGLLLEQELSHFAKTTGRELHLELEPGTFLTANAGILLAKIDDIVDTGPDGYNFIKLNTGMNDILRPSMYGAQHPVVVLSGSDQTDDYIVVGHNCESADLLTPAPGDPEALLPRTLPKANIGDLVLIGGVGAYCASMSAHGYNSFPNAKEIFL